MRLNPQDMADIYASLASLQPQNRGAEYRRASRLNVHARIALWPLEGASTGPRRTGLTRDLSLTGVGLLLSFPLTPEQRFILMLPRQAGTPKLLLCCAKYVHQPAEGLFFIGAEFVTRHQQG